MCCSASGGNMHDEVISQSDLDEVFPRNPIKQVAFEVRFPLNLSIQRDLGDFQAAIFGWYPEVVREYVAFEKDERAITHTFSNKAGTQSIRIADDRFVVVYSSYEAYESFKAEVLERTSSFARMFKVSQFTRVGLRYINNIEIPKEGQTYMVTQYVKPYIDIERVRKDGPFRFATEISMKRSSCFLTSRTAFLLKSPEPDRGIYLLDLDAYVQQSSGLEELDNLMNTLHGEDQREFLSHITDKYKQVMRGTQ